MNILDQLSLLHRLDTGNMLESIGFLYKQCQQVLDDMKKISFPKKYRMVKNIVLNGMGGSALGAHVVQSLYRETLRGPLEIINSYQLPASVNKNTLYIASSYSGNTEEVLETMGPALKRKAKVLVVAGGGKLAALKKKYGLPGYVFDPRHNLSGQPRIGLGYSVFGQMVIFSKLGFIAFSEKQAKSVIALCEEIFERFEFSVPEKQNDIKQLAEKLHKKTAVVVASEFLAGNAHTFANQLNETAKTFSCYFLISEMNHHLLEGLRFPKENPRALHFVFFESDLYHPRNRIRYQITREVLRRHKIQHSTYEFSSRDSVSQSFEMLVAGSLASFYLSLLNRVDPSPVPTVDYFKQNLSKNPSQK